MELTGHLMPNALRCAFLEFTKRIANIVGSTIIAKNTTPPINDRNAVSGLDCNPLTAPPASAPDRAATAAAIVATAAMAIPSMATDRNRHLCGRSYHHPAVLEDTWPRLTICTAHRLSAIAVMASTTPTMPPIRSSKYGSWLAAALAPLQINRYEVRPISHAASQAKPGAKRQASAIRNQMESLFNEGGLGFR